MKNKCSNSPQNINSNIWYYESPTYLEFIVTQERRYDNLQVQVEEFRVPRRKLEASLKRMNASITRKKRK